jgi:hypothetical protein
MGLRRDRLSRAERPEVCHWNLLGSNRPTAAGHLKVAMAAVDGVSNPHNFWPSRPFRMQAYAEGARTLAIVPSFERAHVFPTRSGNRAGVEGSFVGFRGCPRKPSAAGSSS